jgi:hypothetical protein
MIFLLVIGLSVLSDAIKFLLMALILLQTAGNLS